jgi:hypothetical protein
LPHVDLTRGAEQEGDMIRALSLLVALAPLAACGSAPDKAATNQTADSTDYLKRMAELNENERDGVLLRAIRDADRPCQGVQRSVPAPAVEGGPPAWVATCEDGGEWLVAVGANGVATVTGGRDQGQR